MRVFSGIFIENERNRLVLSDLSDLLDFGDFPFHEKMFERTSDFRQMCLRN